MANRAINNNSFIVFFIPIFFYSCKRRQKDLSWHYIRDLNATKKGVGTHQLHSENF